MNFRPLTLEHKFYWYGTWKCGGLRAVLTLMSPLLNTVLNWKYRNYQLNIEVQP